MIFLVYEQCDLSELLEIVLEEGAFCIRMIQRPAPLCRGRAL